MRFAGANDDDAVAFVVRARTLSLFTCSCVCLCVVHSRQSVCVCLWTSSHVVRSKHKAYAAKQTHFAVQYCVLARQIDIVQVGWCVCMYVYCVRTRSRWRLISAATTTTAAARRGRRRGCNQIFAQYCANMRRARLIPRDAVVWNIIIFCANLVAVTDDASRVKDDLSHHS